MDRDLKLSIIIPVYNVEEYILPCLKSVAAAVSGIRAEVLLIDDGSQDSSGKIAEKFAQEAEGFVYLYKENEGVGCARNYGAERAEGQYLAFADSDDLVAPDCYRNMIAAADRYNADLVCTNVSRLKDGKQLPSQLHQYAFYKMRGPCTTLADSPGLVYDSTAWNKLFRLSFYREKGICFPEGVLFEDAVPMLRAHHLSRCTVVLKTFGYFWRIRTKGTPSILQVRDLESLNQKISMLEDFVSYARENIAEKPVLEKIFYRICRIDFFAYLENLASYNEEDRESAVQKMRRFAADDIDLSAAGTLPLLYRQQMKYLLEGDTENLIRLYNYRRINYGNAPIRKTDNIYQITLPEDIFSVPGRDVCNEFRDLPWLSYIDSVEMKERRLSVHGHIYLPRISIPSTEDLKVSAVLINDLTGREIQLPTAGEKRPQVTADRGRILNYDDYRDYHYNYDGTGFCFEIDPENWDITDEMTGNNLILLDFAHPLDSGVRILRGMGENSERIIKGFSCCTGGYDIQLTADERKTVLVKIRTNSSPGRNECSVPQGLM